MHLSHDLLVAVFGQLAPPDLARSVQVCRVWRDAAATPAFWVQQVPPLPRTAAYGPPVVAMLKAPHAGRAAREQQQAAAATATAMYSLPIAAQQLHCKTVAVLVSMPTPRDTHPSRLMQAPV